MKKAVSGLLIVILSLVNISIAKAVPSGTVTTVTKVADYTFTIGTQICSTHEVTDLYYDANGTLLGMHTTSNTWCLTCGYIQADATPVYNGSGIMVGINWSNVTVQNGDPSQAYALLNNSDFINSVIAQATN